MELQCKPISSSHSDDVIVRAISVTSSMRTFNYMVSAASSESTTLCQLSLADINEYLNKSVENCRKGRSDDAIISRHLSIGAQNPPSQSRRCSLYDLGKPLYLPAIPPESRSSIPFSVTTLKSTSFQEKEIFVGLKSNFEVIAFLSDPVYRKLSSQQLTPFDNQFLVSTSRIITSKSSGDGISTFPLVDCESLRSCSSCLEEGANLCSWCLLKGTCELTSKCPAEDLPLRATQITNNYSKQNCPNVQSFSPSTIATGTSNLISFTVRNLPHSDKMTGPGVSCGLPDTEFSQKMEISTISFQISRDGETSVKCIVSVPKLNEVDSIPIDLFYGSTSVVLASFEIPIDQCSRYSETSCSQCIMNEFGCQWCPKTERCSVIRNSTSDNDFSSQMQCALSPIKQTNHCPAILEIDSDKTEYEVKEEVRLVLIAKNIVKGIPINCRFQLRNWIFLVPGFVVDDSTIYCDPPQLRFDETSMNGITSYKVDIRQNMSLFENPNRLTISLYDCRQMATTCSSCTSLFTRYNCAWCHTSLTCSQSVDCPLEWSTSEQTQCREPPVISEFEPSSGPVAGGTELRIFGKNFGSNSDYIKNITIGPVTCKLKAIYLISNNLDSIICETSKASGRFADRIKIEVRNSMKGASDKFFEFKTPQIQHFHPIIGPKSGGTLVEVVGTNLDIGTDHFINFETTLVQIHELTPYFLSFYSPELSVNESWVDLQIDSGIYPIGKFHYRPDPIVTTYFPNFSISAGGINITFVGENFNVILRARITIHVQRRSSSTWFVYGNDCSHIEENKVICPTPAMEEIFPHVNAKIGLKLDGFEYLENAKEFFIIPTPTFQTFEQIYLIKENSVIKFYGYNLSQNLQKSDFKIYLDKTKVCSSVLINSNENYVQCEIKASSSDQLKASKPLLVQIQVGSNVVYSLGYVRLSRDTTGIPVMVLFGVTISALCFLATVAILWYAWKACRVQELYIIK